MPVLLPMFLVESYSSTIDFAGYSSQGGVTGDEVRDILSTTKLCTTSLTAVTTRMPFQTEEADPSR
jgi:hypothetical protein